MVLYAPIVGIGGIIKVAQTKSGMEWVIAIAVVAIMVFIFTLVGIAMPKFKIMQTLVDKVNLVSREILTGLSVIRAFGREKEEEKRFDEANRELTRTQLFTNRVMTFMMPGMSMTRGTKSSSSRSSSVSESAVSLYFVTLLPSLVFSVSAVS